MGDTGSGLFLEVGALIDGVRALTALASRLALARLSGGEGADGAAPAALPAAASWTDEAPADPWAHALWLAEHRAPLVLDGLAAGEATDLPVRAAALRHAAERLLVAEGAEHAAAADEMAAAVARFCAAVRAAHSEAERRARQDLRRRISRGLNEVGRIGRQIHMISVNASIEAARAGPAGRGFAVIGDEIRDLSTEASKVLRRLHEQLAVQNAAADPPAAERPALPPPPPS